MITSVTISTRTLMCFDAHRANDEIIEKIVKILQKFKDDHEIFDFEISDKAIQKEITDVWTRVGEETHD